MVIWFMFIHVWVGGKANCNICSCYAHYFITLNLVQAQLLTKREESLFSASQEGGGCSVSVPISSLHFLKL